MREEKKEEIQRLKEKINRLEILTFNLIKEIEILKYALIKQGTLSPQHLEKSIEIKSKEFIKPTGEILKKIEKYEQKDILDE